MKPPQPPKSNCRYAQRSNAAFPRGRTTQCSPLKSLSAAGARRRSFGRVLVSFLLGLAAPAATLGAENQPPPGFVTLFNGRDLSGWTVPEGDNGHWKALDGVIDCDARSEARSDKSLWTEREFGDCLVEVEVIIFRLGLAAGGDGPIAPRRHVALSCSCSLGVRVPEPTTTGTSPAELAPERSISETSFHPGTAFIP